jgi:hypothetical protein
VPTACKVPLSRTEITVASKNPPRRSARCSTCPWVRPDVAVAVIYLTWTEDTAIVRAVGSTAAAEGPANRSIGSPRSLGAL